jgi:hypothetical protein
MACSSPVKKRGNHIFINHTPLNSAVMQTDIEEEETAKLLWMPRSRMKTVFSTAGPLLTASLVRLHKNAGHSSYSDMKIKFNSSQIMG